ncbi:alpha/beta fold hydrolase [Herbiconiux sp. P17]|uniref:alpha/beta fold hydrolase n=1 Tax=Herbiconiux wuyangfengii TaxID=3342794 RepID=UPI0035B8E736
MKIVVIGGTGLIGGNLVERLRQAGHEAVPASPSTGVDTITGAGLAEVLRGADVVVDIPNSPSFDDEPVLEFFQTSTRNIVEAATAAGVRHHVVLSIVGADRMPNIGYMRAKVAQEQIASAGPIPFSIVRATQFFEFISALAEGGADGDTIRLSSVLMQPIAADDVSAALAVVAAGEPLNGVVELAGPEPLRLVDLGTRVLAAKGDPRTVVAVDAPEYFGGIVTDESLTPGNDPRVTVQQFGPTRFADWLTASFGGADAAASTSSSDAPAPSPTSAPASTKPTVMLVHGAFAESASWNSVIRILHENGITSVAVANPLRSLAGDAAYLRDVIAGIDGPVVLAGHSYAGLVITEAAANNDAVLALVYAAAFVPKQGESAFDLSNSAPGGTLGDALVAYPVSSGGNEFAIHRDLFHHQFAADVSAREAGLMGATQRPVTQAALSDGLATDAPAWVSTPSWFVFGDQDLNIPVAVHRAGAERAASRGTREIAGASHAISVSQPEAVAATILDAIAAVSA